ncbi:unnamed protein product [Hyaloperonospora brassicae]|uniref:Cns1/TTC4 wheel domain-containing protein n=1 Tax=Hyaloperonospora brassicae TaxID=162125 RepID=A0AAV0US01_HYABA|nr:unnamed protein product [Hyaloperonospora brassicae]
MTPDADGSTDGTSAASIGRRAASLRQEGNDAFKRQHFDRAKALYSHALALQPRNHLLYSNRSAACYHLNEFETACADADTAIAIAPAWPKGYLRKAAACEALARLSDAIDALETVLQVKAPDHLTFVSRQKLATRVRDLKQRLSSTQITSERPVYVQNKPESQMALQHNSSSANRTRLRSWPLMLQQLLSGCNQRGVNRQGEQVVLDDGVFAKLLNERAFQQLVYPGIPSDQLRHAPTNLQALLTDPWYEQELLALMPKVQAKATRVLANVKQRGAEQGEVMDTRTERVLVPQVLQEAFGREVLAMVHRVNHQKHVRLANDERSLADPKADFATWDQLDDDFLDELLLDNRSAVRGVAAMDGFMGEEWTQLLLNDVRRMASSGLLMTAAPHIDAKHVLCQQSGGRHEKNVVPGANLRFVEHQNCVVEYPALAELIEQLHALPYEMNKKRRNKVKLCAHFVHCSAVQQLRAGHYQPLRLDCGAGDKDNGFKLTCVYFFNNVQVPAIGNTDAQQTYLQLRTALVGNASVRQIEPKADRLVLFQSQSVFNEITSVPDGEELFYLTFWIHGQALA